MGGPSDPCHHHGALPGCATNYYVQSTNAGSSFTSPLRVSTVSSNPDGSSYNDLTEQFLGDYTGIVNGPSSAYLVWTDARGATQCAAVDAYRNAGRPGPRSWPLPRSVLAAGFGSDGCDGRKTTLGLRASVNT